MASSWKPNASDNEPDIRKGKFWVTHPQVRPDEGGESRNKSNAYLENVRGERVWLWVNDITSDFSLSGTTGQSRNRREFFAHNFAQPSMNINCQTPNSYEYNRLGAFIRNSQLKGLKNQGQVLKFRLAPGGYGPSRTAKGKHDGIFVDGYVMNASRGAERWVNAPDFQFAFAISHAYHFLGLQDEKITANKLRTIMGILNDPRLKWKWENGKPPKSDRKDRDSNDGGNGNQPSPNDVWGNIWPDDEDPWNAYGNGSDTGQQTS